MLHLSLRLVLSLTPLPDSSLVISITSHWPIDGWMLGSMYLQLLGGHYPIVPDLTARAYPCMQELSFQNSLQES